MTLEELKKVFIKYKEKAEKEELPGKDIFLIRTYDPLDRSKVIKYSTAKELEVTPEKGAQLISDYFSTVLMAAMDNKLDFHKVGITITTCLLSNKSIELNEKFEDGDFIDDIIYIGSGIAISADNIPEELSEYFYVDQDKKIKLYDEDDQKEREKIKQPTIIVSYSKLMEELKKLGFEFEHLSFEDVRIDTKKVLNGLKKYPNEKLSPFCSFQLQDKLEENKSL